MEPPAPRRAADAPPPPPQAQPQAHPPPPSPATSAYTPPPWGGRPSPSEPAITLEVLRNGVEMDQLQLFSFSSPSSPSSSSSDAATQHYYTFGRMPGAVTFVLDNPTISRVHAVVQFKKEDGTLHVQDLGSTHGTFVNKQRT